MLLVIALLIGLELLEFRGLLFRESVEGLLFLLDVPLLLLLGLDTGGLERFGLRL